MTTPTPTHENHGTGNNGQDSCQDSGQDSGQDTERWLLQIQEHHTQVTPGLQAKNTPNPAPQPLTLPIGSAQLAARCLRGNPPTPLQIEQAIEIIEDTVMPARARLPARLQLATRDPALHALHAPHAHNAPPPGQNAPQAHPPAADTWLALAAVEQLFDRLAARANGRPATQDPLPVDGPNAARLLILRELLHHWGLPGITLTR